MRDADATRRRLLAAARELFASHGPDATTTREIARRAGGSIDRLFHHFGTKEALFVESVKQATEELASACADPDSALAWFATSTEHAEAAKMLAWGGLRGDTTVLERLADGQPSRVPKIALALAWVVFPALLESADYQQALNELS